jgi:8-oxo-dGTP diphosphatase
MEEIVRDAARLLIRTPANSVLLLRLEPSFRDPFWVTPGGGLDEGETFEEAARRELWEEVGLDAPIGPCIWRRSITFRWEDWLVHQTERTFLIEVDAPFEAVTAHPDGEPITGSSWFRADEIRGSTDVVYPLGLADRLDDLRDGIPATPVDFGHITED